MQHSEICTLYLYEDNGRFKKSNEEIEEEKQNVSGRVPSKAAERW